MIVISTESRKYEGKKKGRRNWKGEREVQGEREKKRSS